MLCGVRNFSYKRKLMRLPVITTNPPIYWMASYIIPINSRSSQVTRNITIRWKLMSVILLFCEKDVCNNL
jgi:hypothetical protein